MEIMGFAAGPYKTNTFIVANDGHAFVVDPGMHAMDRVLELVEEKQLTLDAVVLTHGHLDHTREAGDLAKRENLPVYIHKADEFMLADGAGVSEQSQILFNAKDMVPISDLRYVEDGDTLELCGLSFNVLHAPGHSPGSVLLVAEQFALVGDVIFRGSIGRTDLQHSDDSAMQRTLAGPVWNMDDSLTLLPGHGPTTSMRAERATNPFLRGIGEVI